MKTEPITESQWGIIEKVIYDLRVDEAGDIENRLNDINFIIPDKTRYSQKDIDDKIVQAKEFISCRIFQKMR